MPRHLIEGTSAEKDARAKIVEKMKKQIENAQAIISMVENPNVSNVGSIHTRFSLMKHHTDEAKGLLDGAFTIRNIA